MSQFIAFNVEVEINGEAILSIINGMGGFKDRALECLADNRIKNPQTGKWYLLQAWLNAFKKISESTKACILFGIGKKIYENVEFPSRINNIYTALSELDIIYHMNHRLHDEALFNPKTGKMREGIGHYGFEIVGANEIRMVCDNPYPCDFDRGIIESIANKYKPRGAVFVMVKHDDTQPCRKNGADSCTYILKW